MVAIKELDYNTFWRMFGDGYCENFTRDVYPRLRKHLTPEAANFWDKKSNYFVRSRIKPSAHHSWGELISL